MHVIDLSPKCGKHWVTPTLKTDEWHRKIVLREPPEIGDLKWVWVQLASDCSAVEEQ